MAKPRYSFSSKHTRRTENIRKQRKKYPSIAKTIIENSDIILEVLDSRFVEETRNEDFEEEVKKKGKVLVYVFNKNDLVKNSSLKKYANLSPHVEISCTFRKGVGNLRNLIKRLAKNIENPVDKDKTGKVSVGIVGYPNTGKSSLINLLIGKSSAGISAQAGFTKSLQKLKLSEGIQLLDSPGVIPEKEYSTSDKLKIAKNAKVGARDYSKVSDPEMAIAELMKDFPGVLEDYYKIDSEGDAEILIEKLGKKKGFMKRGGLVNEDKTSRMILKDWQSGEIKL
jgi:ribosome biogenesis GTPase A